MLTALQGKNISSGNKSDVIKMKADAGFYHSFRDPEFDP